MIVDKGRFFDSTSKTVDDGCDFGCGFQNGFIAAINRLHKKFFILL